MKKQGLTTNEILDYATLALVISVVLYMISTAISAVAYLQGGFRWLGLETAGATILAGGGFIFGLCAAAYGLFKCMQCMVGNTAGSAQVQSRDENDYGVPLIPTGGHAFDVASDVASTLASGYIPPAGQGPAAVSNDESNSLSLNS